MYSLLVTAKLNDFDPRTWLAGMLRRISDHPDPRLHELLPWNWARERECRSLAACPGLTYPLLIDATGRCPPEDVGGSWGYGEFLDIMADPAHEQHADTVTWAGGSFDPKTVDAEALANDVAELARKWTRKPAVKRKQPN